MSLSNALVALVAVGFALVLIPHLPSVVILLGIWGLLWLSDRL